jgi:pyruvate kinase
MLIEKKTKIIATIGFNSEKPEVLKKLYEAGVNVFRLNFSHGSHEWHGNVVDNIRSLKLSDVAIMLDTKGPEIRTGEVRGKLPLKKGDKFTLTTVAGVYEDTGKLSINYKEFIKDVSVGDNIVFDGGVMIAKALKKTATDIFCEVIEGKSDITSKRHVNLSGRPVSLPTITEQDWKDIDLGIKKNVDFIALSFVRSAEDVLKVKNYCKNNGADIGVISKIENLEAIHNLADIVAVSDGIMVARGDLGCEIQYELIPVIQKKIISLCSAFNKPVIVATQMLLSMVENIQPTRAEISDVANAVYDGADAVMTSEETTKGVDPAHVIEVMSRIVRATEADIYCDAQCNDEECGKEKTKGDKKKKQQCNCGCQENGGEYHCNESAENVELINFMPFLTKSVEAIVVLNNDAVYTTHISAQRYSFPIFLFTNDERLASRTSLLWNTYPILDKKISGNDFEANCNLIDKTMKKLGYSCYLFVFDVAGSKKNKAYTTIQVRDI